jgi:hypothetical protein
MLQKLLAIAELTAFRIVSAVVRVTAQILRNNGGIAELAGIAGT